MTKAAKQRAPQVDDDRVIRLGGADVDAAGLMADPPSARERLRELPELDVENVQMLDELVTPSSVELAACGALLGAVISLTASALGALLMVRLLRRG